jgi:hypothetical protein
MKKRHWIVFTLSILPACATTSQAVYFEGQSLANQELKSDTMEWVSIYTQAQGCKSISQVDTMVMTMPKGELLSQQHEERWVAHGCNKQFPYTIGYRGDGVGGTYISVKKAE